MDSVLLCRRESTLEPDAFLPGADRPAQVLDKQVRASLAESLAHIHEVAGGLMGCAALDIASCLSEIMAHRVHPGIFGRYYELVLTLQDQRYRDAGALLREIAALAPERPELSIRPFSVATLGADDMARYARLIDMAEAAPTLLGTPSAQQYFGFERRVEAALGLIGRADAQLAAELRGLIVQILGAVPPAQDSLRRLGGASSFMLWGAIFLNVVEYRTVLDLFEAIVHEGAHQLLFGQSRDEPLVTNPIEERFESPLRRDPRPMVGVFHSTFVSARIHYAYRRLVEANPALLPPAEIELVEKRLEDQHRRFLAGYKTVHRDGRLTATGERLIAGAHAYMKNAAPH
jgi:HEXXH motif-containing protein